MIIVQGSHRYSLVTVLTNCMREIWVESQRGGMVTPQPPQTAPPSPLPPKTYASNPTEGEQECPTKTMEQQTREETTPPPPPPPPKNKPLNMTPRHLGSRRKSSPIIANLSQVRKPGRAPPKLAEPKKNLFKEPDSSKILSNQPTQQTFPGATTQPGQTQPGQDTTRTDTTRTGHNPDRHNPDRT